MKNRYVLALTFLAACDGGGNGDGSGTVVTPPPPANERPGGIWFGTRPNGTEMVVLLAEDGNIRIIDEFGNQGFGTVMVANQTDISASYKVVPQFGRVLIDGSEFADCTFSGSVRQRQAMTIEVACMTSLGGMLGGGEVALTYDTTYDMDSSIARIAGTYQNPAGDVMTIDVNGALFLQNVEFACVVSGAVSLLDTDWNLYGVELIMQNCLAEAEPFNGASWSGLVTIASLNGTDTVLGGLTADVDGHDTSLVVSWQRL